jgi:hypothetical protein
MFYRFLSPDSGLPMTVETAFDGDANESRVFRHVCSGPDVSSPFTRELLTLSWPDRDGFALWLRSRGIDYREAELERWLSADDCDGYSKACDERSYGDDPAETEG